MSRVGSNISLVLGGVIGTLLFFISLPLMVTNLITAQDVTDAPTDFTSGLAISFVLLGLSPVAVLVGFIFNKIMK